MTRMNWIVFLVLLFVTGVLSVSGVTEHAVSNAKPPRPRFEKLYQEDSDIATFSVYHDREAGVEFVCRTQRANLGRNFTEACFPTGRTWK